MRLYHLFILLVLSISIAVLQHYALHYFLFWKYWWMDILLHSLGGIVIGGVSLYISQYGVISLLHRKPFVTVIPFALIIVIAWEVFELMTGIPQEKNYFFDTVIDIGFGFGMALLTVTLLWRRIPPQA